MASELNKLPLLCCLYSGGFGKDLVRSLNMLYRPLFYITKYLKKSDFSLSVRLALGQVVAKVRDLGAASQSQHNTVPV